MSKGITWRQTLLGDSTMTSCAKAMKLMQPLMDGQLAGPDRDRVLEHLRHCVDCGLKYETYVEIKQSVQRQGAVRVDSSTVAELAEFARSLSRSD